MRDALIVIDVLDDFDHPDGDLLLASFRQCHAAMRLVLDDARSRSLPVIYANDNRGVWDGDLQRALQAAEEGRGGDVVTTLAPRTNDTFVVKPRYSAFDLTPLELILAGLDVERLVMIGASLERCVAQTAIDARERGWKVTVIPIACAFVDGGLADLAVRYLDEIAGVRMHHVASMPPARNDVRRPVRSAAGTGAVPTSEPWQ